jgi:hypothetical protein
LNRNPDRPDEACPHAEDPPYFHYASYVVGYDEALSKPLQTLVELQDYNEVKHAYRKWMLETPSSAHVCFLDITYKRIDKDGELYQVLITPPSSADTYSNLLDRFFEQGYAMAAHPVFSQGLPIFSNRAGGAIATPETEEELRVCLENTLLECEDRRVLWWQGGLSEPVAGVFQGHDNADAYVEVKRSPVELNNSNAATLSRTSIFEVWKRWIGEVDAKASDLRSNLGVCPGFLAAAPIGITTEAGYHLLASVFLGLDKGCTTEQVNDLLRRVYLQVFSANASYIGAIVGRYQQRQNEIASAQHEIKRVADAITASSPAVILDTVRTYFFTLFGISGEFVNKMIAEKKAPQPFMEAHRRPSLQTFFETALRQAAALQKVSTWCSGPGAPTDDAIARSGLEQYTGSVQKLVVFEVPDQVSWTRVISLDERRSEVYWVAWNGIVAAYRNALRHGYEPDDPLAGLLTVLPASGRIVRILNLAAYYAKEDPPMESGTGSVLRNYVREASCDEKKVRLHQLTREEFERESCTRPAISNWSRLLYHYQPAIRPSETSKYRTVWLTEFPLPEFLFVP